MKKQNNKGLLALLGIGTAAWAFWKYKTMPPEQKEELKSTINNAVEKVKKTVKDMESSVAENYDKTKDTATKVIKES